MVEETGQPYAYTGDNPVNETDPTGLHVCNGNPLTWGGCVADAEPPTWNGIKSFVEGLAGTPRYCGINGAAYDVGNVTWWTAAIAGFFDRGSSGSDDSGAAADSGSLTVVGEGFSESEQEVAQMLAAQGDVVVLRQASGIGRTSDLLVNGVPYDVYTPSTGNVDRIVSAVASKGSQVAGGGVVIDLRNSNLTVADLNNILARVQGVTTLHHDDIGNLTDMAKFRCVCGQSISTSDEIPNPNEWRLISDIEFDDVNGPIDAEALYQRMRIMYRCPVSDHLWVFWDGFDAPPKLYAPELIPSDDGPDT